MTTRYEAIHESPNGPGDSRPTALQIIQDEKLANKLTNKKILITGCSSGIGTETAKALFTTGATLYLTARDLSKAKEALGDIATSDRVHLLRLDLDSLASVRSCAKEFLSQAKELNIFIANAGVMAPPEGRTADGFETQFGTNHLAHFLLFNLLLPALLAASTPSFNSRALFLSSVGHRLGTVQFNNLHFKDNYDPWAAYGQSKTANLWTANHVDRLYGSKGLHAWAVHPGGIFSGLQRHLSPEAVAGIAEDPYLKTVMKTPEQGASTTVWAATAQALEGQGGKYLEDCHISKPFDVTSNHWAPGYGTWAYDVEGEAKLWEKSLELVGLKQ